MFQWEGITRQSPRGGKQPPGETTGLEGGKRAWHHHLVSWALPQLPGSTLRGTSPPAPRMRDSTCVPSALQARGGDPEALKDPLSPLVWAPAGHSGDVLWLGGQVEIAALAGALFPSRQAWP